MLLLTLVCALISAAAIAVVALWHRYAPAPGGLAHEKALYAAFIADVDRRLAAGELDSGLAEEERVEAGRALLKAQAQAEAGPVRPVVGLAVTAVAVAASFGIYMLIGNPGFIDQPYQARVRMWTHLVMSDPKSAPPEYRSIVLRQYDKDPDFASRPQYWLSLGEDDMLSGNVYLAMKDYRKAQALAPAAFTAWSALGEAITLVAGGRSDDEALAAFHTALTLDPDDARAHVYLGRDDAANGRFDAARLHFQTALAHMSPDNPSREEVEKDLKDVGTTQVADVAAKTRIGSMVASLAAQLKADPDNVDGWARLLRSYDVLGDTAAHDAALAAMQAHYRQQPEVAAAIVARSRAPVGREGGA